MNLENRPTYQIGSLTINTAKSVIKVNINVARKLYDKGKVIYLNAHKTRLNNMWTSPLPIDNKDDEKFDVKNNEYIYYNCNNILGNYPNYYVEVERVKGKLQIK